MRGARLEVPEAREPLLTRPFVLLAVAHTLFGLAFFLFLHLPGFRHIWRACAAMLTAIPEILRWG